MKHNFDSILQKISKHVLQLHLVLEFMEVCLCLRYIDLSLDFTVHIDVNCVDQVTDYNNI